MYTLGNHYPNQGYIFITPESSLLNLPVNNHPPATGDCFFNFCPHSLILPVLEFYIKGIVYVLASVAQIMLLKFISVVDMYL